MSVSLKHVDLLLDEALIEKLNEESRRRRVSVSEVVRALLSEDLGVSQDREGIVDRVRKLRNRIGPTSSDSTAIVRESRDHGW
jgi:Arc/MetJ-type ribon-helix-helix transcriptional regulator